MAQYAGAPLELLFNLLGFFFSIGLEVCCDIDSLNVELRRVDVLRHVVQLHEALVGLSNLLSHCALLVGVSPLNCDLWLPK